VDKGPGSKVLEVVDGVLDIGLADEVIQQPAQVRALENMLVGRKFYS
jgi:hypothetical protein